MPDPTAQPDGIVGLVDGSAMPDLPDQPTSSEHASNLIARACPVTEVIDRVAGKWSILIIIAVADAPARFTELERAIDGISRRMLTLTLRNLERDGLLTRTVYATVPPKVDYRLTEMARELLVALQTLTAWAERHRGDITAARLDYDATLASGILHP